ncbi:hypothetical protein LTR56_004157 [Elasticomyces elasticus]|nr:hypothetical protein LTR22_015362 [Elasticomyces elasticus]KAK3654103.1 hypothetical protein LTR56_004157 [Elasticomyces elasticus]KAK4914681.1 hypothetical protein LTR49_017123 [Elasticomyces elasticus]KAK5753006.1 hypothetical protein LTS12_016882 [Elasticomyces elasticus]
MAEDTGLVANHVHNQQTRTILAWISDTDYSIEQHAKFEQVQPGTGQWFLQHSTISEWISGDVKTVFCSGHPGAGKSVMASLLVRHLQDNLHNRAHAVVKLYCDYGRQPIQTSAHFRSSVLRQLLSTIGTIPPEVNDCYRKHSGHDTKPTAPTEAEITRMLHVAMQSLSVVYVVVDALDEATFHSVASILDCTEGLPAFDKMHILVTSRWHQEIASLLAPYHLVEVRAADDDIGSYIKARRNRLPGFVQGNETLVARIFSKVMQAADGLFLLVRLHLDSFHYQINAREVENTLDNLPTGIDAYKNAYDAAITRVMAQPLSHSELAHHMLMWVHSAKRPLQVSELRHILAVGENQRLLDVKSLPDINIMLSVCAGLVEAVEQQTDSESRYERRKRRLGHFDEKFRDHLVEVRDTRVVRFVHYTVEQYFMSIAPQLFPEKEEICATKCIVYLCFLRGPCENNEELVERFRVHAWLDYAAHYWHDHFREAEALSGELNRSLTKLAQTFLQDLGSVASVAQAYTVGYLRVLQAYSSRYRGQQGREDSQDYMKGTTGVHLTARLGLTGLLRLLLKGPQHHYVNMRDDDGEKGAAPLYLAVERNDERSVAVLIECDADVNGKGGKFGHVLQVACHRGCHKVVRLLIANGANIDAHGGLHTSALQAACQHGHESIVRLLLAEGADVDAWSAKYGSSLETSASIGNKALVQLLLLYNAQVNLHEGSGNALCAASSRGYEAVVRLLVDRKANVNARCECHGNPLCAASSEGHETIAQLLLDNKADVNAHPGEHNSALHAASYEGHEAVIQLLIDRKADVNAHCECHGKALCIASFRGHEAVVRLLLDNGAYVNDNCGCHINALESALLNGHESIVLLLLGKGADFNSYAQGRYVTELARASGEGRYGYVQLLLKDGADIDAQLHGGCTALHAASSIGHVALVKLLLEHGADVNAHRIKESSRSGVNTMDPDAVQAAWRGGHMQIMRMLRAAGARNRKAHGCVSPTLAHFAENSYYRFQRELIWDEPESLWEDMPSSPPHSSESIDF